MLLALDIGNTNLTIGSFRSGALVASGAPRPNLRRRADELELLLDGLLRLDDGGLADVCAIALRGVVPGHDRRLEPVAARRGQPLLVAGAGPCRSPSASTGRTKSAPIGWSTRSPRNGCTARRRSSPTSGPRPPSTASPTTGRTSVVRSRPGLELGLEALAARTAKLPRIELATPDRAIGRDTVSAMQSGTVFGYQALATGLLDRIRRELADSWTWRRGESSRS